MQVKLDNKVILEISKTMLKVIGNDIRQQDLISDLERRLSWVITHKYEQCFKRLKSEWDQRLASPERGISSVPTDKEKYAELVFSQPDYINRSERDNNAIGS